MQNDIERANIVTVHQNALKDIDSQYIPYVKENIFDEGNISKYIIEINTKIFACTCIQYELETIGENEDAFEVRNQIDELKRIKEKLEKAKSDKHKELIDLEESRNRALVESSKAATVKSLAKRSKVNFIQRLFKPFLNKINGADKFEQLVLKPLRQRNERIIDIELPIVAEEALKIARKNTINLIDCEEEAIEALQKTSRLATALMEKYEFEELEEMASKNGRYYIKGMEVASSESSNEVNKNQIGGTLTKISSKSFEDIIRELEINARVSIPKVEAKQTDKITTLNTNLVFEG